MNLGMNHTQHFLKLIIWPGLPTEYDNLQDQKIPSIWISILNKIKSQTVSWRRTLKTMETATH